MTEAATAKSSERLELGDELRFAQTTALLIGGGAIIAAIALAYFLDHNFRRFYFAYLISFAFVLSISLGAVFFVLLQHLVRAGWSVAIRRIAETLACAIPLLLALSAPVLLSLILHHGDLYRWAGHEHSTEHVGPDKSAYLNPPFFITRICVYFIIWSGIGIWYWRKSVEQDATRDDSITIRAQTFAAPAMLLYAVTVTLAAFDLLMSLDPEWFSTIFGVYFFSGAAVAIFATLIILVFILQNLGYLTRSITLEHYHDLGKLLFAFTFFWGYIAFSQYMLLWYANIPEETGWFARRGATSVDQDINSWTVVALFLLFGHLIIPFAGLLSRHVKRSKKLLVFWAAWLLVFHWLDLYWIVMPEMDGKFHLGLIEPLCLVGVVGIYIATAIKIASRHNLRPLGDPRLVESLAFENI